MTASPAAFELMDQDSQVILSVPYAASFQPVGPPSQPEAADQGYGWHFVAAWFTIGMGVGALATLAVDILIF